MPSEKAVPTGSDVGGEFKRTPDEPQLAYKLGNMNWADFAGRWNVFIIACALSGVAELALWMPATYESAVIGFAVMYGFVSCAFIGLFAALPESVSPMPEVECRMGVVMLFVSIPALTMAPIGGQILQSSADGWVHMKIVGGAMCFAGSAIMICAKVLYTQKFSGALRRFGGRPYILTHRKSDGWNFLEGHRSLAGGPRRGAHNHTERMCGQSRGSDQHVDIFAEVIEGAGNLDGSVKDEDDAGKSRMRQIHALWGDA
ncbi:uncharacterized protein JN550_003637 [Neoarthrinium moseri]|uniref:uncharacterized protein n=1 Tax=Neoarthrinium moseri TaxID=1658444 RepID=UPI001FDC56FE|nr:uncharacterized protein JN550_003637 [Neoarthrinium moseri]KAI1872763.1 hypothetical protein JN550_003637 [Neoarthrinium moseri]